jgi:hypothetical protein
MDKLNRKEVTIMTIEFRSIGQDITQRTKLSDMPGRDKVNLCWQLLIDLGITQKIVADQELYDKFQAIWKERTEKFW